VKLIIQIPCYNEEVTLPATLRDLPQTPPGIDLIEYLIVDDGSTARTIRVADELSVQHIVCHQKNRGLAAAFVTGLDAALALGAHLIVNADADNQYYGIDVGPWIQPILDVQAGIVVGDCWVGALENASRRSTGHFSALEAASCSGRSACLSQTFPGFHLRRCAH
jgi:glycosyltransferase involved in cell wall biosynthesis